MMDVNFRTLDLNLLRVFDEVMAERNLWKTTELIPLLRSRGINLSNAQVHRLVTTTPERIPARTFAALCDILDCSPNDLFEPYL